MADNPARILLLGVGRFGYQHLLEWQKIEKEGQITLAGAVTATKASREKLSKTVNIPVYCFEDFNKSILKNIDGVDIVTPSHTHADLVRDFLPHVHVLVEKPIAMTYEKAEELISLAAKYKHILMPAHIFRFHPLVKKAKELIVNISAPPVAVYGTFINPIEEGVESLDPNLEFLHLFDIIDFLYEKSPEIFSSKRHEMVNQISLRYPGPFIANLELGWRGTEKIRNFTLRYEDRWFECNLLNNLLFDCSRDKQVEKHIFPHKPVALGEELRDFALAISGEKKASVDAKTGSRIVGIGTSKTVRNHKCRPKIAVIGGGVFGTTCALKLSQLGDVELFERRDGILQEASYYNQWRHHSGFHYPISYEAILEIKEAKDSFEQRYGEAVIRDIPAYFCTSRFGQEIPAERYLAMCKCTNLNYTITDPPPAVDPRTVSICIKTDEGVYDITRLKQIINQNLSEKKNIRLHLDANVLTGNLEKDGSKNLKIQERQNIYEANFDYVVNATYANWHVMAKWFGFAIEPIRLELLELLVIEAPLDQICITIIDAPFHSLVGMGEKNRFILSHRDHSVIRRKIQTNGEPLQWAPTVSNRENILSDAIRYMPILKKAKVIESWYITRAISAYERDFWARPTIVKDHGFGCWSILGGKILTCVTNASKIASSIEAEL